MPYQSQVQHIIRSIWAKTYHQTATNNGVWSSKSDHAVFYTDVSFALLVGHHIAKVSNMPVVSANIHSIMTDNLNDCYYYIIIICARVTRHKIFNLSIILLKAGNKAHNQMHTVHTNTQKST